MGDVVNILRSGWHDEPRAASRRGKARLHHPAIIIEYRLNHSSMINGRCERIVALSLSHSVFVYHIEFDWTTQRGQGFRFLCTRLNGEAEQQNGYEPQRP